MVRCDCCQEWWSGRSPSRGEDVRVVVVKSGGSGGCCQGSGPGGVAPGEKMSGVVVVKSDGPGGGALGE